MLLVAATCALFSAPARAAERPLLWAADESGGAPYVFQDPEDPTRNVGFEVDLKDALEREIGRPIKFKHYDFKSLILGLQGGDFDFAMNGLEVLPEYQDQVLFSRPYYVYQLQLAVRKGDRRFTTLEELQRMPGASVATLNGSAAERSLRRLGIAARGFDDQTSMYETLKNGAADAVYIDLPVHAYYLKQYPDLELTGRPGEKGYYAIAFRKDERALADQFNAALGRLIAGDQLRPIYEKWGVWTEDQRELARPEDVATARRAGRLEVVRRDLPYLLGGALLTILLSVLSMALAVSVGMVVALARLYGPAPVQMAAVAYVEFFRGVPVLLLLFFLYFAVALPLGFSALATAVVGLGLNYAAYESEIYRAAVGSIPPGQWEAAASLGMSPALTFRRIILPQAVRIILPPMTSDFVALFKDTSVVSVIGLEELTKCYQTAALSSLDYLDIGIVTLLLYLIMSVPLGFLSRWLEQRWGKGVA